MDINDRNRKNLNEYKDSLKLTKEQHELLIGGLLGDLSLRKIGKYSRLVVEQKNKEYLFHLYGIFKDYVRTPPKERLQQRLVTSKINSTWYFSTISHVEFEYYYKLFYIKGKKIIPLNIKDLLTDRGIAYWYMDDGAISRPSYILSTACFSELEHFILQDILLLKFDIICNIHRGKYWSLYIPLNSKLKFQNLIKPYIINSMLYKL